MVIKFSGSAQFRNRIVCSVLSSRPIVITDIHPNAENPGLNEAEGSFLRLMDKLMNGCELIINKDGTALRFSPGVLTGGTITHDCGKQRSIGWYLESVLALAPFGKEPLTLHLTGITNDDTDMTVDFLRTITVSNLQRFGVGEELSIKVTGRGAPPEGGGSVTLQCPIISALSPLQLIDPGKVRKIRGVAYCTRVSPMTAGRMIDGARGVLSGFTGDVFINTDHHTGKGSGLSPGFGLALIAETTTGCLYCVEKMGGAGVIPENVGKECAAMLCEEILRGGCVDTHSQTIMLLYMIMCPEHVSKIRLGPLSDYTIEFVRLLHTMLGVNFKIKPDDASKTILMSCLGLGIKNLGKKIY